MFLGITGNSNRKMCWNGIFNILLHVLALIHLHNLLQQIVCMIMSLGMWLELSRNFIAIAPENQKISDSQKIQINQCFLGFALRKSAANNMRNHINFILSNYCGSNSNRAGTFPDNCRSFSSVNIDVSKFLTMVRNVYVRRIEFH